MVSSSDGNLYNVELPGWTEKPVRRNYSRGHSKIESAADLKATLRNGAFAWPGGYPLFFITSDGGALAFETVRAELRHVLDAIKSKSDNGWRVVACDVNWEDTDLTDDHTGKLIESAYGGE